MNLDLTGKNALVGGASAGLGLAAALELSLLGANITLLSRTEEKLEKALKKLDTSKGQQHSYAIADFTHPDTLPAITHQLLNEKGAYHILINNSGGPASGKAIEANPNAFIAAFQQHLISYQILTQALVPGMQQARYGRIINIISTSVKEPIAGLGVSNTIRGAVASWGKTLATELGPSGITVNNVLPGYTRTARYEQLLNQRIAATGKNAAEVEKELVSDIPARRIGEPEDFGAAVAFICSPAAAYINGVNLPVDGGRLKSM